MEPQACRERSWSLGLFGWLLRRPTMLEFFLDVRLVCHQGVMIPVGLPVSWPTRHDMSAVVLCHENQLKLTQFVIHWLTLCLPWLIFGSFLCYQAVFSG